MLIELFSEDVPDPSAREGGSREEDKSRNGATFLKQRFRYKGAQSEGNRYIKNMQL